MAQRVVEILLLVLGIAGSRYTDARNYNVSLLEMSTCKEYYIHNSGYLYQEFFHVNSLNNNKIESNERLHLKFYVVTPKDAHILMSVNDKPLPKDRVYEVVIDAGGNTFSALRLQMGTIRASTNQDPRILSLLDPTPIEIIQTKDGNISVYIPGLKKEPLLTYLDRSPLQINYISFSTFGPISAKWYYDCKFDGFENEMEQEVRPVSPLQRLLSNITEKAENKSLPLGLKAVNFSFQIRSVNYNHDKSILQTRLNLLLYWQDERLAWDPKDFNGIEAIVQSKLDIWTPDLIVLNGAFQSMGHFRPDYDLIVYYNGSISLLVANAEFSSWCFDNKRDWPHERLNCGLILGLEGFDNEAHEPLQLDYDYSLPLPNESINTLTEWQFREVTLTVIVGDDTQRYSRRDVAQTIAGDISLEFVIQRNGVFYKNVFTMPIVACEILLLLSFLLRGYRRGALILVVFVIISLGLMFATKHAPHAYVPNTLHAYRHVMYVATFCYLLHITIIWLEMYSPKAKPWDWLMALINSSVLRLLLCMRVSDCAEYVEIQSYPWRELAKMYNNLFFTIFSIYFVVVDVFLLSKF